MADYFPHYPTPIGEVVGIAGELVRHSRDANATVDRVKQDMGRATDAVDGDLLFPMEAAPRPFELNIRNVANGAYFASGAIMLFAQAVRTYNSGIDRLNAQIPEGEFDALSGLRMARLRELQAEESRLEAALDDEAARVAGMLERGPNAEDMGFLRDHGFLLPLDPATDPALRWALSRRPNPGDPAAMRRWWASLTLAQQAALIAYYPRLLGNANGLPAEVRDEANRLALDDDYNWLMARQRDGELTPEQARVLENIKHIREQLAEREKHVDPMTGQPVHVQLYIYDPYAFGGDGRVAIATGNLDDADHIAVDVPGVGSSTQGLGAGTPNRIYDESRWASGGDSVAVLDWMGYDSPNNLGLDGLDGLGAATNGMADDGAQRLAADVAGLRTIRSDDPTHLTVYSSSYGSTTAGIAAEKYGLDADDLILVGSPGVPADSAGDLTTGHDHTWVGSASRDPITGIGGISPDSDPAEDDFGAQRFRAERVDRDVDGSNHGGYDDTDSEGLYNVGAIVAGQYGDVQAAEPRHVDPFGITVEDPEKVREPEYMRHRP